MLVKMLLSVIQNSENYQRLRNELNDRGIYAIYTGSKTHSVFRIQDLDQGYLGALLVDNTEFSEYNFLLEVDIEELDKPVPSYFPYQEANEDGKAIKVEPKTLREYVGIRILEKDGKALLPITYSDRSSVNKDGSVNRWMSSDTVKTNDLLLAFIEAYGDEYLSNIYTQDETIAEARSRFEEEIIVE